MQQASRFVGGASGSRSFRADRADKAAGASTGRNGARDGGAGWDGLKDGLKNSFTVSKAATGKR